MLEVCRIHNDWILHTERSVKKRFQYCLNSNCNLIYLRAIQGHSGGAMVDPRIAGR